MQGGTVTQGEGRQLGNANKAGGDNQPKAGNIMWRMRVCPIMFADFCRLRKEFQNLVRLSQGLEYRMSQHLGVKMQLTGDWADIVELKDKELPWLPNEKTYTKPQNAATAGMIEMMVEDSRLVEVMTVLRTGGLNQTNRLRFELKRMAPDSKKNKETTATGTESLEGKTTEGEEKMEEEGEVEEEEAKKENPEATDNFDMEIHFAVRLSPVKGPAFTHPKGHQLKPEDKQLFLTKVPPDVPDNVLKMIVMLKLLTRKEAEDGTHTAVFEQNSERSAQAYMELFEGVLLDWKELEMSTSLGSLRDSKKKHAEQEARNRRVNAEQVQGLKRKLEEAGTIGAPEFKKPRSPGPQELGLPPPALMWMNSHAARARARGMARGSMRGPMPRVPLAFRGIGRERRPVPLFRGRGMPMARGRGGFLGSHPRGPPLSRGSAMRGRGPARRGGRGGMPMRGGQRGRGGMRFRPMGQAKSMNDEPMGSNLSSYRDIRLYQ